MCRNFQSSSDNAHSELDRLRKEYELIRLENANLKEENAKCSERMNNLAYIVSDLNTKIKVLEEEKASLITAVRLINEDQNNQFSQLNQHTKDHNNKPPITTAKDPVNDETTKEKTNPNQHNTTNGLIVLDESSVEPNSIDNNHNLSGMNIKDGNTSVMEMTSCQHNTTDANKQHNNSVREHKQPKNTVPCPFLIKRGYCLKGSSCDFSHFKIRRNVKKLTSPKNTPCISHNPNPHGNPIKRFPTLSNIPPSYSDQTPFPLDPNYYFPPYRQPMFHPLFPMLQHPYLPALMSVPTSMLHQDLIIFQKPHFLPSSTNPIPCNNKPQSRIPSASRSRQNHVDVIAITETWLNPEIPDGPVSLTDYSMVRKDRASGKRGGGVCAFIKSNIPFSTLTDLSVPEIECVWLKLRPHRLPRELSCIFVGVIYHPPSADNTFLQDYLIASIDKLLSKFPNAGIMLMTLIISTIDHYADIVP